jgi:phosphotransferase system enzyme I (PtsI)
MTLINQPAAPTKEQIFYGIPASPGIIYGFAFLSLTKEIEIPRYHISSAESKAEINRLHKALAESKKQIKRLRSKIAEKLGELEAGIFDAHLMILEDKFLIDGVLAEFQKTNANIEYCFYHSIKNYSDSLNSLEDDYIKERVSDIHDVTKRVLQNLLGCSGSPLKRLTDPFILISEDLRISETLGADKTKLLGIALNLGSRTSHAAIMSRSLKIPSVVGLHTISQNAHTGDGILINGYDGVVIVNPTQQTIASHNRIKIKKKQAQRLFESINFNPAETKDGKKITLLANIDSHTNLSAVFENHAEGIGLFRTESLFLQNAFFPSEIEQFEAYKTVVTALNPYPVTIRTIDLGGDKWIEGYNLRGREENPFMGFRAIRFCLEKQDVFKTQLRAILRASAFGKVNLVYPMISSLFELQQANALVEAVKLELKARQIPFDANICIGAMIETPSAAFTTDLLAKECKFFSIGTNDLIQYMLAVDRINDKIAYLYEPSHIAIIRALKFIIDEARKYHITVSICGEMAGDPMYMPLLVGLGADTLSLTPTAIPEIRYFIRATTYLDIKALTHQLLQEKDSKTIFQQLKAFYDLHVG